MGHMLGSSCNSCCTPLDQGPCPCLEGQLPDTVTVTLSGPQGTKEQGPPLLPLRFAACFGSGAEGFATAPGGVPEEDIGPISDATVTDGGSGYAKLGRVEPTLTITGSGEDATFTPTLQSTNDECGVPTWKIVSASVSGGTGYIDNEELIVTVAEDGTEEFAASLILRTTRTEPDLTATVDGSGEGAEFSISYEEVPFSTPTLWGVDEVTVTSGGTGYVDGDAVEFELGAGDVEESPASAVIRNVREEPELTIAFGFASIGTGAQLTPVLEKVTDSSGLDVWQVESVTVDDGGSEYADNEQVIFTTDDTEREAASAEITVRNDEPTITVEPQLSDGSSGSGATLTATLSQTTDENGKDVWQIASVSVGDAGQDYIATDSVRVTVDEGREIVPAEFELVLGEDGEILSVTVTEPGQYAIVGVIDEVIVYYGGEYFRDTGVVSSVEVFDPGGYYRELPDTVTVANGGKYYREDAEEPPYIASVSVTVLQGWPGSLGSGATFTATVDSDTSSETFGQIASVAVTNGGTDYLGWRWIYLCDCDWIYGEEPPQDHAVVAWRDLQWAGNGDPCTYVAPRCFPPEESVTSNSWIRTGPFALIRAVVTSDLVPAQAVLVEGKEGKPGRDNGPLVAVGNVLDQSDGLLGGYAFPGRVQDQPSIVAGTEVAISATMSQQFEPGGIIPYWIVTAVTVPPGIEGFENNQFVELESTTQEPLLPNPERDEETRRPADGRAIVDEDGVFVGITILNGGVFYNESADVPVITRPVTVEIQQYLPSEGSGAEIAATVNTDLDDADFGTVTLALTNPGDGYLGGYTGADFVIVTYPGPSSPPTVQSNRNASPIGTLGGCSTTLTADGPIANCDEFSFEATFGDQTATVSPGGEVAPPFEGSNKCCHKCFVFCPEMPDQVVATFTREANEGYSMRVADNVVADGLPLTWGVPNFEAIAPQGAYYTTCPEHEVEVVWDVDDLHNENRCSVDFCGELPEEESCGTVASISEETKLFFGYYAISPDSSAYGFGVVPDDQIGPGEFPSHFGGAIFDAAPEFMVLDVAIEFISDNYNQDPHEGVVRVVMTSAWSGSVFDGVGIKTNTYTKPSELACGSVPGEWDEVEELAGGSQGQQLAQELGEEYGLEQREWEADVDDYHSSVVSEGNFSGASILNLQRRRICKNYEVTVDFQ
jgi:hypothetical protein